MSSSACFGPCFLKCGLLRHILSTWQMMVRRSMSAEPDMLQVCSTYSTTRCCPGMCGTHARRTYSSCIDVCLSKSLGFVIEAGWRDRQHLASFRSVAYSEPHLDTHEPSSFCVPPYTLKLQSTAVSCPSLITNCMRHTAASVSSMPHRYPSFGHPFALSFCMLLQILWPQSAAGSYTSLSTTAHHKDRHQHQYSPALPTMSKMS